MSLKTRCPACDTVFKVVPDQLKVSKGWVRCGRCAEVFDASAHAASPDDTNSLQQISQAKVVAKNVTGNTKENLSSSTITPKNIAQKPEDTPDKSKLVENKAPTDKQFETNLSFVRVAKNKAFWQQKSIVTSLRTACVGLIGLLFFQVVFGQRHYLVAANPNLAAGFDSICHLMSCKIEPLKNIDAFKIDSSSFHKAQAGKNESDSDPNRANAFALKMSIKNNADLPLLMPAVELTLTDANDKPVLRRVLFAKDIGFQGATLAANGDWLTETAIAVMPNPANPPISGYRVLLFYP